MGEICKPTESGCARLQVLMFSAFPVHHEFPPRSNNSLASLTLVAKYGLPPRSGWFNNINFLWFFLILSLAACGLPNVLSLSSRINAASFLVIFCSNPPLQNALPIALIDSGFFHLRNATNPARPRKAAVAIPTPANTVDAIFTNSKERSFTR